MIDDIVQDYNKGVSLQSLSRGYGVDIHTIIKIVYARKVK